MNICCYNCRHFGHGAIDCEDPYDVRINHCHYPSKGGHRFDNMLFEIEDNKKLYEISPKCPMTEEQLLKMFEDMEKRSKEFFDKLFNR